MIFIKFNRLLWKGLIKSVWEITGLGVHKACSSVRQNDLADICPVYEVAGRTGTNRQVAGSGKGELKTVGLHEGRTQIRRSDICNVPRIFIELRPGTASHRSGAVKRIKNVITSTATAHINRSIRPNDRRLQSARACLI